MPRYWLNFRDSNFSLLRIPLIKIAYRYMYHSCYRFALVDPELLTDLFNTSEIELFSFFLEMQISVGKQLSVFL